MAEQGLAQNQEEFDITRWYYVAMAAYWVEEACKDSHGIWTAGRRDYQEGWHVQVHWDGTYGC